jgi:hypothetical protein
MWAPEQWKMFTAILKRGFVAKDPFTPDDENVYRLLLDSIDPEKALAAVREIVLEGQALRPRPGEIVERARRDRSRPTFDEAYQLIFGPGGAMSARLPKEFDSIERGQNEATVRRARELHPLVGEFVVRQGPGRLRRLPLEDPQYGELHRRDLREAWERHVQMFEGRELAALSEGRPAGEGLRQLDPLAALGMGRRELEAGE